MNRLILAILAMLLALPLPLVAATRSEVLTAVIETSIAYELFESSRPDGNASDYDEFKRSLSPEDLASFNRTYSRMADWKIDRSVRKFVLFYCDDIPKETAVNLETVVLELVSGGPPASFEAGRLLVSPAILAVPEVDENGDIYDLFRLIAKKALR